MKIVVLDGHALNPGDLDWKALEALGEVKVYDRTALEQVVERAADAEVLLTNKCIINASTIAALPVLRYIGVMATGYNIVDIVAAKEKGIVVTNAAGYGTPSVAQFTFALLLELCHHVGDHARSVAAGEWVRSLDFSYWHSPLIELNGRTMGIVGLGKIGQAVAQLALAFGMQVIAYHTHPQRDSREGVRFVDLPTCFREADVVSLHCPLNNQNSGFVNKALLSSMKPAAFLINTSRGGLINEQDLAWALNESVLAGAGLDVLSIEPPLADNPLFQARNCLITPHIAWATRAARSRLMQMVVDNLKAYLAGMPQHVVSFPS